MIRSFMVSLCLVGTTGLWAADWAIASAAVSVDDSTEVSAGESAQAKFDQLVADYEAWQLERNPIRAGRHGDLEAASVWPDASAEAVGERRAAQKRFFGRLARIDKTGLDGSSRISYEVLHYLLRTAVEIAPFRPERIPFVNDSGFFSMPLGIASSTRLASLEQAEAWLKRLEALPAFLAQHQDWMKQGIDENFVQPAYVVKAVVGQLEAIIATPPAESPLLEPFATLPERLAKSHRRALNRRALEILETGVYPAYADLLAFFNDSYLAEPRATPGISEVTDGRAYYRALVRQHTTLDTTPEQVHQRGLDEVARIRGEMEEVIAEVGFEGSFAEFLKFLRSDPQFYAQSARELLMHASFIAKRVDDLMPRYFGRLPRLPYGVRPVPAHVAPTYTTGRYWPGDLENGVAGGYMVNTYALDQRPLYSLPALTLHEAVPGHHHQGALSSELEDVPEFRRNTYITAFGEGWGLYAEHLGVEMGIYQTPYEHFGRLTYEMWRACRLVVDTGIHYFGWTREQAEACLLENSALAAHNVTTEVARYISWPGQALAYKTGELLIRDLRARAESALGDDFDLRAFHDHLLAEGALPLSALEARMVAWIKAGGEESQG
ncbi:MAG: DUF885 domain-containing protein [Wenzhouxiangellaceae bacterium]|nr:DUF885 domain-containing protein [Wenzhouxiangellaceae bacterium]